MATVHCCNRAQLCVHESVCVCCMHVCVKTIREVEQMREGEGWQAACKFKKLAFDCVWPQLKQSKSLVDGKPKKKRGKNKMSYYLPVCFCHNT